VTDLLTRTFESDLEIRSAAQGGDGRTIVGIAVPWNKPVPIPSEGIIEEWQSGAFDHQLRAANRVRFGREHLGRSGTLGGILLGAARLLRNDARGLYGEFRVSATRDGDEALELVRDGALTHLSIGFRERPRGNRRMPGGRLLRVKADLTEVVVTYEGAYGDLATVSGVRSIESGAELLERWNTMIDEAALGEARSRLDEARQILAGLPPLPLP
jgi:HK97 family phage prohead protease